MTSGDPGSPRGPAEWAGALLIARRKPHLARKFHLDEALIAGSRAFLRKHPDHTYSFVDCSSFGVMNHFGLRHAATTNTHFTEAAFIALLRETGQLLGEVQEARLDAPANVRPRGH